MNLLLQSDLDMQIIPWQIAPFLIDLNDSNNTMNLSQLITTSGSLATRTFSTSDISPDFFTTFFSRRSKADLNGAVVRALAVVRKLLNK